MILFRDNKQVKQLLAAMFSVSRLPAVTWACIQITYATVVVGYVLTTQASFFSVPPYNFTPEKLGLMCFAIIIGSVLGFFLGGWFSDWLVMRLTKRNGGLYEPEFRLWTKPPLSGLAAGGVLPCGIGASVGAHWMVPCLGLASICIYIEASLACALG